MSPLFSPSSLRAPSKATVGMRTRPILWLVLSSVLALSSALNASIANQPESVVMPIKQSDKLMSQHRKTAFAQHGVAVRPLAQDYVEIARSPDPERMPIYTPAILALPNGRLVAAFEYGHKTMTKAQRAEPYARIMTSDDGGKTWQERTRTDITAGRLFTAGNKIYFLGHRLNLRVVASVDGGDTWSDSVDLTKDQTWHQSACNIWKTRGNIYLVMERRTQKKIKGWGVGELAPVILRAKETDDLSKPESWTFSNELPMVDLIEGYRENTMPSLDYFGVPFYRQNFPQTSYPLLSPEEQKAYEAEGKKPPRPIAARNFAPLGLLESNLVQITDPRHIWYDPTGKTFHIFARTNTGGTGYAALLKAVEKDDGTIEVGYEYAPSGKKMLFLPMPGGQMRFHVLYDPVTRYYWLLSTQATDSMIDIGKMDPERYNLPNNERQRMVLHFSKNMVDWSFAGLVTAVDQPNESRHYAAMDIDGNDLVIISRSGDKDAKSAHDGNLATFHRIKDFRSLLY